MKNPKMPRKLKKQYKKLKAKVNAQDMPNIVFDIIYPSLTPSCLYAVCGMKGPDNENT